ncbi:DEAD/DEAH box helicase [Pedobacter sp. SD-b]|uniref:DEAD/DEAH box helicase n=1 Tax=Pedobacter segetis TaxID=2793069 RepID=A0ABS1BGD9_9SPHI|nr:DEAD/DEAH box helicase [Pedobacter segetis]MBK0381913.1 DEAD/DEAH box helicase [Pedobacter segetis]
MENTIDKSSLLKQLKIKALNPMQLATDNAIQTGKDVMVLSSTGSGKTLAFLIPLLFKLKKNIKKAQVMVIVPSRELALQIEQVFRSMQSGFKVSCIYGGHSTKTESQSLSETPSVIIGTPGKISYHIRNENINPAEVEFLVLDEFDKSLEMGFQVEMEFIIQSLSHLKQKILTSATKMEELPNFAKLDDLMYVNFLKDEGNSPQLALKVLHTKSKEKLKLLMQVVSEFPEGPTLIFCNHREAASRVSDILWNKGMSNGIYHGGMDQPDREKALVKFRNGTFSVLVTTDLASRGLDIPDVQQVIHYQIPFTEESFTHRNGRTARMKASGKAYLLLADEEFKPDYVKEKVTEVDVVEDFKMFAPSDWKTIYIAAGKKDKINKIDVVGLLHKKADLQREDIGLIEVFDHMSYVAVKRTKINATLSLIKQEKIKGKKYKIGVDEF